MVGVPKPKHKKLKLERAQQVLLQEEGGCWVCDRTDYLEDHHIFGGANREKSERYGLKIKLCVWHHNLNTPGDSGTHFNKDLMIRIRQAGQTAFEAIYGHERFMREFGRNYL